MQLWHGARDRPYHQISFKKDADENIPEAVERAIFLRSHCSNKSYAIHTLNIKQIEKNKGGTIHRNSFAISKGKYPKSSMSIVYLKLGAAIFSVRILLIQTKSLFGKN